MRLLAIFPARKQESWEEKHNARARAHTHTQNQSINQSVMLVSRRFDCYCFHKSDFAKYMSNWQFLNEDSIL
jgi:hypothetical protein